MTTQKLNQLKRFKEAAKELGCDEDEARFDDTVKKLAKARAKSLIAEQRSSIARKAAQARWKLSID